MILNDDDKRLFEQIETDFFIKQLADICQSEEEGIIIKAIVCKKRKEGDKILKYGIRKIRVPLKGRGTRGGGRVIYFYQDDKSEYVLFLMIFSKNERETLTHQQEQFLIKYIELFLKTRGR